MFSIRFLLRCVKILLLAYSIVFGGSSLLVAREWTDNTGQYHVEAEFVRQAGEKVHLLKPDGRVIEVVIARLNEEGRLAVAAAARNAVPRESDKVPTKPGKNTDQANARGKQENIQLENSQAIAKILTNQKKQMLARMNSRLDQATAIWNVLGKLIEDQSEITSRGKAITQPPLPAIGPVEAVQSVVNGLADLRPRVLWDTLPLAYQQDLELLGHDYSTQMDPELWQAGRQVLQKAIVVMRSQRKFLMKYPLIKETLDEGNAKANAVASQSTGHSDEHAIAAWNATVNVLELIVESDLADLPKLRTLDFGLFLDQTGVEIMHELAKASHITSDDSFNQGLAMLSGMQVSLIRIDDTQAVIRLTLGEQSEANQMTLVGGKWIPAELASAWPHLLSTARTGLATLKDDSFDASKSQLLEQLQGVDALLDQLLAAKTQEEFDSLLDGLFVTEGEE